MLPSPSWNTCFGADWHAFPPLSGLYLNFQIDSELARLPVRFPVGTRDPAFLGDLEQNEVNSSSLLYPQQIKLRGFQ